MFHINNFFPQLSLISLILSTLSTLSLPNSHLSLLSLLSPETLSPSLSVKPSPTPLSFPFLQNKLLESLFNLCMSSFVKIGGFHVIDLWRYKEELVIGGSQRVEDSRNWASSKRTGHGNDPRGSHDHGWCIIVYLLIYLLDPSVLVIACWNLFET